MFTILTSVTKALFQQFEVKTSPTGFDPYQTEQFYQDLNHDAHTGTNFDLCCTENEEEEEDDAVFVDKMETEDDDICFIHGYPIRQPGVNRMQLVATTSTAKGIFKKVSTGARLAYSSAHSGKKALQKKAMHFVSAPAVEEEPTMKGYGADFCPLFERPYDSGFGADLSNRKGRRGANVDAEPECMDIPMKTLSAIETENDPWQLV